MLTGLALVIFVFFTFSYKLFYLQIVENDKFSLRSMNIIYREDPIPAERGRIFDRHYKNALADNLPVYQIGLDCALLPAEERFTVFGRLEEGCALSRPAMLNLYETALSRGESTITLKENATFEEVVFVAENSEKLPGVYYTRGQVRQYHDVGSLSHVLGYLGRISGPEYKMLASQGYTRQSMIGKQGIEKSYDSSLMGEEGIRRRTVDYRERTVTEGEVLKKPVPGHDLILTIDHKIQRLCERSLGERSGSVVVMKPHNGEILALVSWPWYDNNFNTRRDGNEMYRAYQQNPRFPLLNRTIQSRYAPASTFKMIMTAAILETEALSPDERVYCPGYKRIGRRDYFHCHKRSGHGSLNLSQALAESCNVYFFTAGYEHLGPKPDIINKFALDFGLGRRTGIDIPGEVVGLVPDEEWMKSQRNQLWVGGDTVNISIGQGNLLVTPLQMAAAVSMVCNRGKIVQPHLMKEIRDPKSRIKISEFIPEIISEPEYLPETLETTAKYMRQVITEGTARKVVTTKAVEAAGKTGTAEIGKNDRWHSWFVCFAPWDADPEDQVVIVVMVEAENEWEWWSAKAANIILQGIFAGEEFDAAVRTSGAWYAR